LLLNVSGSNGGIIVGFFFNAVVQGLVLGTLTGLVLVWALRHPVAGMARGVNPIWPTVAQSVRSMSFRGRSCLVASLILMTMLICVVSVLPILNPGSDMISDRNALPAQP